MYAYINLPYSTIIYQGWVGGAFCSDSNCHVLPHQRNLVAKLIKPVFKAVLKNFKNMIEHAEAIARDTRIQHIGSDM